MVPDQFREDLLPGCRVLVPLGNRITTGFVVRSIENPEIEQVREIEDMLDAYPLLTSEMLELTRWVSTYYVANWGDVIRAALPPGLHRETRCMIQLIDRPTDEKTVNTDEEDEILSLLSVDRPCSLSQLTKKTGRKNIRYTLSRMEKAGRIRIEHIVEDPRVRIKSERWIVLKPGLCETDILKIGERAPKQAEVLSRLAASGGEARRSDLDVGAAVLRTMEEKGLVEFREEETMRDPYAHIGAQKLKPVRLTADQSKALQEISHELVINTFSTFLIFGVTASGKTQVYIEAIKKAIENKKTALVLVPEISLTPQAVQRYRSVFGDDVAVLHSRLSAGERYDAWRKIREGKVSIALGPRSAVFAPLDNLGLIVVDEEQDASYKQMDPSPRYHARDVAVMRGKLNRCVVLLGSATPSLETFQNAVQKKYRICRLPTRIDHVPLPNVHIVEMMHHEKNSPYQVLSPLLQEKMKERFQKKEQVILLQNRRGFAAFLRCSACGHIERCKRCDITLTYHQNRQMLCHYCGFQKPAGDVCSQCGGATLAYRGVGTQRVEQEIKALFPGVHVLRMDLDTTRRKGAHDEIITQFEQGKGDVLLGTQMVAKGHDFPGVSLVGIISADTGIHFPDFRAGERVFQLLTQAAGRSGRRNVQGEVVVQTLYPDHPVLCYAAQQDYEGFFHLCVRERKDLHYPPWGRLMIVRFKGKQDDMTAKAARAFEQFIQLPPSIEYLGPMSAPVSRVKNWYRYQVIFRIQKQADPTGIIARDAVRLALERFYAKTHFPDIRIGIDVDPMDMM